MTLKGNWKNNVSYSVGDVVVYTDNVVYHLQKPAKTGTPCTNTLYWERLDQSLAEAVELIMDAISMAVSDVTSKVANNLTTTASGKILDARQGKALKDLIDGISNSVVNNLTTSEEGMILDARQGKALKDALDTVNPDARTIVLASSTSESTKKFGITVDDDGELTATEIVPEVVAEGGET